MILKVASWFMFRALVNYCIIIITGRLKDYIFKKNYEGGLEERGAGGEGS